ncbi:MAG: futalosine hydrolase [Bacteroidales bacterium]|jgi:futalosine hydrolase|nr:futalosine hydrolase [Bacteroidales bacterium]MDD4214460.1 futalosine hydrolase [Bacteroidales bacterium]
MKILIVSATQEEIKPLANTLKVLLKNDFRTYQTELAGHQLTLLITGVGMVSTAYRLGQINLSDFDLAINAGIAGSFNESLAIGEMVNVYQDCFAELGADYGDKFISLNRLNFSGEYSEPFFSEDGFIKNQTAIKNPEIEKIKKVSAITVNTLSSESSRIEKMLKNFSPDIESMEGAAFFYACLAQNISCFQLRTISNYIEPRNLNNWNIPFAIALLNKKLPEIIKAF